MKKIIAFAGSNSKTSINKQLVGYTTEQLKDTQTHVLDLNDFELPIYSIDYENEYGIPQAAHSFLDYIKSSDGIVLSLAEHNGAYSTAFKNIFDWMSRIDGKLWSEKPMLLMAAAPGARGGQSILEIAKGRFPFMGGNIVAEFSLPFFHKNFENDTLVDGDLQSKFDTALNVFKKAI